MTKKQLDNWIDQVPKEMNPKVAFVSTKIYHKIKMYFDKSNKYRGLFFSTDPTIKQSKVIIQ